MRIGVKILNVRKEKHSGSEWLSCNELSTLDHCHYVARWVTFYEILESDGWTGLLGMFRCRIGIIELWPVLWNGVVESKSGGGETKGMGIWLSRLCGRVQFLWQGTQTDRQYLPSGRKLPSQQCASRAYAEESDCKDRLPHQCVLQQGRGIRPSPKFWSRNRPKFWQIEKTTPKSSVVR